MNPNFGYGGYQLPPGFSGYAQSQAAAGNAQGNHLPPQGAGATNNAGAAPPAASSMMPPMGVMPNMMMTDAAAAAYMAGVPSAAVAAPATEKKSKVHYCTIHPEGMPRSFDVPFVERRLPVCDRCKKNFKSRDLCRKRDGHKALPWQMTYVVVTMDSSVLHEDENGNVTLQSIPMVCELQDTPHMCLGPADGSMKSEPICKVCREKNYTRDYCRNTCKHTTPPWSTTYVKLVADTKPKDDDRFMQYSAKKRKARQEDGVNGKPKPQEEGENVYENSDDLSIVHKSRTFLCSVSSTKLVARVSGVRVNVYIFAVKLSLTLFLSFCFTTTYSTCNSGVSAFNILRNLTPMPLLPTPTLNPAMMAHLLRHSHHMGLTVPRNKPIMRSCGMPSELVPCGRSPKVHRHHFPLLCPLVIHLAILQALLPCSMEMTKRVGMPMDKRDNWPILGSLL